MTSTTTPIPDADTDAAAEVEATEQRIARRLATLITTGPGSEAAPPPYLRRHLVEHAAAGDTLDDHTFPRTSCPISTSPACARR